jgi:uncharacterized membrane protein YecN with MAPEG domain
MDHDPLLHAAAQAAALWTALNLLLLLVLSLLVVRQRAAHHVPVGDGGVPALAQAIRAFGNAAEYVPGGIGVLVALAVVSARAEAIHIAGALLLGGRVTHAIGLSLSVEASRLRSIGMLATWAAYIFGIVALLIFALT